jgi:hypothetical protein
MPKPFKPGVTYAVAIPASGTIVQNLSPGCRYVRIAGTQSSLVAFGNQPQGLPVGSSFWPEHFDVDGYPSLTFSSLTASIGTLYVTEMSN